MRKRRRRGRLSRFLCRKPAEIRVFSGKAMAAIAYPMWPDGADMRLMRVMLIVMVGSGIVGPGLLAQPAATAASLLEAATQAELVDGDLDAAIKLYQRVITSSANDRAAIAAGLLGLGRSYEQLGQPKAREIYERLVSQYSDRTKEASAARVRLTKLAED